MILKEKKGFTLIELLIVIALIGVLAVALLSTINPVEQTRKAKDSSRKAAAAELLNSTERFQATFLCYPWEYDFGKKKCDEKQRISGTVAANIDNNANLKNSLVTKAGEMKEEFFNRDVVKDEGTNALYITEDNEKTNDLVYICFYPQSNTFTQQAKSLPSGVSCGGKSNCVCVPE